MKAYRSREVKITLSEEYPMSEAAEKAIGYLATWAFFGGTGRYSGAVTITEGRDQELEATYRDMQGNVTFAILAAYDADTGTYSFHS